MENIETNDNMDSKLKRDKNKLELLGSRKNTRMGIVRKKDKLKRKRKKLRE